MAGFESARGDWERAFAAVPDAALTYLKPGDDYSLGGMQVHVVWVLRHYTRVLDQMRLADPPGEKQAMNELARNGITVNLRRELEAEMASLHDRAVELARGLSDEQLEDKTPVDYEDGNAPYPTSPADVIGWLRDHYQEHVDQTSALIQSWKAQT